MKIASLFSFQSKIQKKESSHKTHSYEIIGMNCASCAVNIEQILEDLEGVVFARVNFQKSILKVSYDDKIFDFEKLKEILQTHEYEIRDLKDL